MTRPDNPAATQDTGASGKPDRATHEPSPDGLGHTVSVPSARLKEWGYAIAEGAGYLRAVGALENDPDATAIAEKLTQHYAEVAHYLDAEIAGDSQ